MRWVSDAHQDKFAYERCGCSEFGIFLDIGCGDPQLGNNTYTLETELKWRGLLMDISPDNVYRCQLVRRSVVIQADALQFDWKKVADDPWMGKEIDYLSLDIDDQPNEFPKTVVVLKNLIDAGFVFKVITVEHDAYRMEEPRRLQRELLSANGYELTVPDICGSIGRPFEDWWTRGR